MEISRNTSQRYIWVNNRRVLAQFEVSSLDMSFALKFEPGSHELISLSTVEAMGFLSFLPLEENIQPVLLFCIHFFQRNETIIALPPKIVKTPPVTCLTPTPCLAHPHTIIEEISVGAVRSGATWWMHK